MCGHPTGDCEGTAKPPIRVIGESFAKPGAEVGVLVDEDIYEEVWLTPYTRTMVLVAKAGSRVPFEKAVELGLKTR